MTKRPICARILGIRNAINEVRPNIFIKCLIEMVAIMFMEFIYLNLFIISVNFPNQLVIDMSKVVLRR